MFQYISCYSLSKSGLAIKHSGDFVSIHLMLLFIFTQKTFSGSRHSWFQYISCYSLSFTSNIDLVFNQAFQYISCYSLSMIYI